MHQRLLRSSQWIYLNCNHCPLGGTTTIRSDWKFFSESVPSFSDCWLIDCTMAETVHEASYAYWSNLGEHLLCDLSARRPLVYRISHFNWIWAFNLFLDHSCVTSKTSWVLKSHPSSISTCHIWHAWLPWILTVTWRVAMVTRLTCHRLIAIPLSFRIPQTHTKVACLDHYVMV